jgi:hypothetical protein
MLFAVAVLSQFAGCGDSPTSPGIQPQIVNEADHFSYQVSNMRVYSATTSYSWQNGGVQATINQACAISGGSATLVVLDGAGTQVYSRNLSDNGTFTTSAGTAGAWTVRVVFATASGTLNFRADRTT